MLAAVSASGIFTDAHAQSITDRIKKRAEQSIGRKIDGAVDCAISDTKCIERAKKDGKQVNVVPAKDTTPAKGAAAPASGTAATSVDVTRPGGGAWANYDFKPGERILYADDFTKDEVGDFPRSLEFVTGSIETVTWPGTRWLRLLSDGKFYVPLKETLPTRDTLEFDIAVPLGALWLYPSGDDTKDRIEFADGGRIGYHQPGQPETRTEWIEPMRGKMYRARVMADGRYLTLYINEKRLANIPNALPNRTNKIFFHADGDQANPTLFGNFRIAAGGRKLHDAIAEKGLVATQRIYFDTGSDRLRPESTPTLKEIAAMLTEHTDLKLVIEGHTDNVGNAASNQTLSEQRAAAVVQYLVQTAGIDASRLSAKGFGATKPADSNDTPEGRQNNRRVELVKM